MATLSEADAAALLAAHGVPVAPHRLAATPDEAALAADDLGFPVVVKLCGAGIAHKTERGLVRLGLTTHDAVRAAAADLLAAARPEDRVEGVLVASMVTGARELIAGVVRDPTFGPCVMLGFGGILAEAVGDVAFRAAPLAEADAVELIEDLRTRALLGPFRGEAAVDRDRLASVLVALGDLVAARPDIAAVDVNPLVVTPAGEPVAVDALVEVR
jgi:acetyl-CoA synthetase (ADP-forming)